MLGGVTLVLLIVDITAQSHNGHRAPTPAKEEARAEDDPDDMHPASALLFLKKSQSSELQGHHRRPQTASR